MTGEIDRDWYCTGNHFFSSGNIKICMLKAKSFADDAAPVNKATKHCSHCHRKWPTPEQYKNEYGREYPEDAAIWVRWGNIDEWLLKSFSRKVHKWKGREFLVVCACTPWGKPDDNWRPS